MRPSRRREFRPRLRCAAWPRRPKKRRRKRPRSRKRARKLLRRKSQPEKISEEAGQEERQKETALSFRSTQTNLPGAFHKAPRKLRGLLFFGAHFSKRHGHGGGSFPIRGTENVRIGNFFALAEAPLI